MFIYTLEKVCQYCRNYFVRETVDGNIKIVDGKLHNISIPENTYFIITGSIYNDGLHEADDYLVDEDTFYGCVSFLAIPNIFINLVTEIDAWITEQKASPNNVLTSPYTSETFDEYSYSKTVGKCGWKAVFEEELSNWRKV